MKLSRRELLAGAAALAAAPRLSAFRSHITKAKLSAITDEIGRTQAEAIAFAHQYGLNWVELRNLPETRKEIAFMTEPEVSRIAAQLGAEKLKVSFLNTSLMKFAWPGLTLAKPPANPELMQQRWDRRLKDLQSALNAANILGVDKIRVFTGDRVEHPETTYQLIKRTVEEMIPLAEKAKVYLLLENEYSQNIGSSQESKDIMELLPSKWVGLNWDPQNAVELNEKPWPDGYKVAPVSRFLNVQYKAAGVLEGPKWVDWKSILNALQRDNYQGIIGQETHGPGDKLIENANASMKEMQHIVGMLD